MLMKMSLTQDLETFDLEDFKYNFVNISAFRIVDADSNVTRQLLRDMEKFQPIGQSILNRSNVIQVSVESPSGKQNERHPLYITIDTDCANVVYCISFITSFTGRAGPGVRQRYGPGTRAGRLGSRYSSATGQPFVRYRTTVE